MQQKHTSIPQANIEGASLVRTRVETMVNNLQGAVLHLSQHHRRLLPSTMLLEAPPPELKTAEQDVLNLLARGLMDAQIAYEMKVTVSAVATTMKNLMEKLGVDTRGELIRIALDNDLITD